MKKHFLIAISALFVLSACKKDGGGDSCPQTMEAVAGTYKLQSFTVDGINAIPLYFEECERDNQIVLAADGSYTFVDAGVQCDPSSESSGSWSLTGTLLTIDLLPAPLTIEKFDCKNLRGTANVSGMEIKATLRKQ